MNATEKEARDSFADVVHNFLGNKKNDNYKIVERMLTAFQALGCNMSIKVHFLHSHVDYQIGFRNLNNKETHPHIPLL